eukprot:NODE_203_length_12996_cov_1.033961.p1 type:complete len:1006 gc:universal NODE_203_length_12996_cov_1.033961:4355-7372(+)
MSDQLSADIRYALKKLDVPFVIERSQSVDYRILHDHDYKDHLLLFSSSFVIDNNGHYPYQLVELLSENHKQEIILRSIAGQKPCCNLLSCLRFYKSNISSRILKFYLQLNPELFSATSLVDNLAETEETFEVLTDIERFDILKAYKLLQDTRYDISLVYHLPIILQSYIFTFHFELVFKKGWDYRVLLRNSLYLDKQCRHHIFRMLEPLGFEGDIHFLLRGFDDGERDDEDEFINNEIMSSYNFNQLLVAYSFLSDDLRTKRKRITHINRLELKLLSNITFKDKWCLKAIILLKDRKPLECLSLMLQLLDCDLVSTSVVTTCFEVINNLWNSLDHFIKRDLITQFVLPMLYKSYNAPLVTRKALDIFYRFEDDDFIDLKRIICLSLCPPLPAILKPKIKQQDDQEITIEIPNIYYDHQVGCSALKCLSSIPVKSIYEYIKSEAKEIFSYVASLKSDDANYLLRYIAENEVEDLNRSNYLSEHTHSKYSNTIMNPESELQFDNNWLTLLLIIQLPYTKEQFNFDYLNIVEMSHEIIRFSQFIYHASGDKKQIVMRYLSQLYDSVSQVRFKSSAHMCALGCLYNVSTNQTIKLMEDNQFMTLLIKFYDILDSAERGYAFSGFKIFYQNVEFSTPFKLHTGNVLIEKIQDISSIDIPALSTSNNFARVEDQRIILWRIGFCKENQDLLSLCTADSLSYLKLAVEYITNRVNPHKLYTATAIYTPPKYTLLFHILENKMWKCLEFESVLPTIDFPDPSFTIIENQAPFNPTLSSYFLNHFNRYLNRDGFKLLLNLFGIFDEEFNSKINKRGKKTSMSCLDPTDIRAIDKFTTKIDWLLFASVLKSHTCIVNVEAAKFVQNYLFEKLSHSGSESLLQFDYKGLQYHFQDCIFENIGGEFIMLNVMKLLERNIQLQASEFVSHDLEGIYLKHLPKLMTRSQFIDLMMYHKRSFEEIMAVLEVIGKNEILKLESNRLGCLMKQYPESLATISNLYFQPNKAIEEVFEDVFKQ